jgi:hypothetical protein
MHVVISPAIYEVRGIGVKLIGSNCTGRSVLPLPWGEVDLRSKSGEGLRPNDRP